MLSAEFSVDHSQLKAALQASAADVQRAPDVNHLLTLEAHHTKLLYKLAVRATGYGDFSRAKRNTGWA